MRKQLARFLALIVVVSLICVGVEPVVAAEPGDSPPTVYLELDDSGGWVLQVEGVEQGLRSEEVNALSTALSLGLPSLAIPPGIINVATNNKIGFAALLKEGEEFNLFLNQSPAVALTLRQTAISYLASRLVPGLEKPLTQILDSNFAVVARFPGAQGDIPDLAERVSVVADGEDKLNIIELGLTLSPDGELVSVGGIDAATLGMSGKLLDLGRFRELLTEDLALSTASINLSGNTTALSINEDEWLVLALNLDYLRDNLNVITGVAGFQLGEQQQQLAGIGLNLLKDTEVHVNAYLATDSQESAPRLTIGRPLFVSVRSKALLFEGVDSGIVLDDQSAHYLEKLGSLAFVWDGQTREVRSLVGQKPLPVIALDEGLLTATGNAFAADLLPWDLLENLLTNTRLTGEVTYEDNPRSQVESLDYQVKEQKPPIEFVVELTVSKANGGIAVWGVPLPLSTLSPAVPDMVRTYASQLTSVDEATVGLGPNGLALDLGGPQAHVRWDAETRSNTLDLVLGTLGPELGMPSAITSGMGRSALEGIVAFANAFGLEFQIDLVDEEISEGALDKLMGLFF